MILVLITHADLVAALPEGFVTLCLKNGAVTAGQGHRLARRLATHESDRISLGISQADAEAAAEVLAPYAELNEGQAPRVCGLRPPDRMAQGALPRSFGPTLTTPEDAEDDQCTPKP